MEGSGNWVATEVEKGSGSGWGCDPRLLVHATARHVCVCGWESRNRAGDTGSAGCSGWEKERRAA